MPFVHCPDCGASAMIDPSGRCPEGHIVGAAGARVAAAIGRSTPHPDEPQPWVAVVDDDPTAPSEDEPRAVRPPSIPSEGTTDPGGPGSGPGPSTAPGTEGLLDEIHQLGDLELAAGAAAAAAVERATPPSTSDVPSGPSPVAPVTQDATSGTPAPPSSPEEATDLDALANLAAAVRTLDDRDVEATASTSAAEPPAAAGSTDAPLPPPPPIDVVPAPTTDVAGHPDTDADAEAAHEDEVTAELSPPAVLLSPFDGSFTARGDRVSRGSSAAKSGGLKGLFRR